MAGLFTIESGAARAIWLAELSIALDEAHEMTCRLSEGTVDLELMELHIRIEAARHELVALRYATARPKRSSDLREFEPDRTESPWPLAGHAA